MENQIHNASIEIESLNGESLLIVETLSDMRKEIEELVNADLEDAEAIPEKDYNSLAPLVLKKYQRKNRIMVELLKHLLPELKDNLNTADTTNKEILKCINQDTE